MKNVIFFIGSLQLGGTEAKLARNFLPYLKKRGRVNPKLLVLQKRGEFFDLLPDEIETVSLNETTDDKLFSIIPKFKKALLEMKADVVISCMWYTAIISYFTRRFGFADFKHIVHDTVNMTEYIKDYFRGERNKWLKIYLTKIAYRDAEAMTVVSYGEKEDLVKNFGISGDNIHAIYNPINKQMISNMAQEDAEINIDMPLVVSVGRLEYQKGFDILLKAFRKVRDSIACKLVIVGEGSKRGELIDLAGSLNLDKDVIFVGFQQNPFKFMKKACVFCLASRYEGIGNVIFEAMVLGVPVVAADCPSGPSEILDGGKYGMLVPIENPDALADALIKVLTDNKLRQNLSALSLKRAGDFDFEASLKQWEDVILGI